MCLCCGVKRTVERKEPQPKQNKAKKKSHKTQKNRHKLTFELASRSCTAVCMTTGSGSESVSRGDLTHHAAVIGRLKHCTKRLYADTSDGRDDMIEIKQV